MIEVAGRSLGACCEYDGGGSVHFGPAFHYRMVKMSSSTSATIHQPVFTTPFRGFVFLSVLDRIGSPGVTVVTTK